MALFANFGNGSGAIYCSRNSYSGGQKSVSVTAESGGLKVNSPYNAEFVSLLKAQIPSTGRKWDPSTKCWYVAQQYSADLKLLIDQCYGCDVVMPNVIGAAPELFEVSFQADYVANCKNDAASVHCNGGWNARIPENVLRKWFKQVDASAPATLYGLLGIDQKAKPEDIKKAYKRTARQWHPDICKEENASEMFHEIKKAYDILIDPLSRNKYNAGLMFEAMSKMTPRQSRYSSFTPLLRCGQLTVKAKRELGMLIVDEILEWTDIENEFGQIMVSYWCIVFFSKEDNAYKLACHLDSGDALIVIEELVKRFGIDPMVLATLERGNKPFVANFG
jgi:hypothetical protein